MPELYRPTAEQYLSSVENRAYTELLTAQEAYNSLWREIETIFATSSTGKEAEEIIHRTLVPKLTIAQHELNRALKDWMDSLDELHRTNT